MIIPGNGNTGISENWFPYAKAELEKIGINVIAKNMPDPELARRKCWIPFIEKQLGKDERAILIGHSSGAVAVLRFLEDHRALGAAIIGACFTDLGDEREKKSGYFNGKWKWEKIRKNCEWIIQFASPDDPYIPIEEPRHIRNMLGTEYRELAGQGHFGADVKKTKFPELVEAIKRKVVAQ